MMKLLSFRSVAKAGEHPDSNADRFFCRGDFAGIADGVSQSHRPGQWAEIVLSTLAMKGNGFPREEDFVQNRDLDHEEYGSKKNSNVAWYARKLVEQGGQATALWCEVEQRRSFISVFRRDLTINLFSMGDCSVFVIDKGRSLLETWPYPVDADYPEVDGVFAEKSPHLRGTFRHHTLRVGSQSLLLFVTDALGRYLHSTLGTRPGADSTEFETFLAMIIENGEEENRFAEWVSSRRSTVLEDDDTTYMLVQL